MLLSKKLLVAAGASLVFALAYGAPAHAAENAVTCGPYKNAVDNPKASRQEIERLTQLPNKAIECPDSMFRAKKRLETWSSGEAAPAPRSAGPPRASNPGGGGSPPAQASRNRGFAGIWRGVYTCSDFFGDGNTVYNIEVSDGAPSLVTETFTRGPLGGTIVYVIDSVEDGGQTLNLSTNKYGGFRVVLKLDAGNARISGFYINHSACTTIRLSRQ